RLQDVRQIGRVTNYDFGAPGFAEGLIAGRISDQMRHDAFPFLRMMLDGAIAESGDQIFAHVSVQDRFQLFIQAIEPNENLHGERVFIGPMFINCGFADAGARGDGVHAGGVNSLLGKKVNGSFENFLVRLFTARSGHWVWFSTRYRDDHEAMLSESAGRQQQDGSFGPLRAPQDDGFSNSFSQANDGSTIETHARATDDCPLR